MVIVCLAALWTPLFAIAQTQVEKPTVQEISKKLRCLCGCNFPDLASCSCDDWAKAAKSEIQARLIRNEDENTILKSFIFKYGETVLTAPLPEGFNRFAWIIPSVALFAGLFGIGIIVRKWINKSRGTDTSDDEAQELDKTLSASDVEHYRKKIDAELYGNEDEEA